MGKNNKPEWGSLKKLWNSHKMARSEIPPNKSKMISTALTIINIQRYLKLPQTQFVGVWND